MNENEESSEQRRTHQVDSFIRINPDISMNWSQSGSTDLEGVTPPPTVEDYERLFMKDAYRRAHDAELSALATLAMIRSNQESRDNMMLRLEMDMMMSPSEVVRRLHSGDSEDEGSQKK